MRFLKIHANSDKKKTWDYFLKERIPKTVFYLYRKMYEEPEKLNFKKFDGLLMIIAMPKVKNRGKNVSAYVIRDSSSRSEHISILFIPY